MNYRSAAWLMAAGIAFAAETIPPSAPLVAHEWGTFTSVANLDGNPIPWLALGGPSALPCFVHGAGEVSLKSGMYATVRMETPVVYFYAPRQTVLRVSVSFLNGLITEWYPQATHVAGAGIEWEVEARPGATAAFPRGTEPNHYYEARATDAVPLRAGKEEEKLIFYRGAGNMAVPVRPRYIGAGRIELRNAGKWPVPAVIVFENRGGRVGFRAVGELRDIVEVDAPELSGDAAEVRGRLSDALVSAGLYPKEAAAMLATWRESWFEEGTRVFWVAPRALIDVALPMSIVPAPAATERVFVGRVEVLSPVTQADIMSAARSRLATAVKYGRFALAFRDAMSGKGLLRPDAYLPVNLAHGPCAK